MTPVAARRTIAIGALSALLAVALGAFGAHGLRGVLDADHLRTFETAVRQQTTHAIALVLTGLLAERRSSRALSVAALAFGVGSVLFCGSVYALAFDAPRVLGVVAPVGGLAFMAGWLAVAVGAFAPPASADRAA
ncbi:MAG: DUF423 domain-containing protein [Polyangiales bacterium]